ncbi:MAG: hypothetical protein R3C44_15050 [Chloroflexota bacterium]
MDKRATSVTRPGLFLAGLLLLGLFIALATRSGRAANFPTMTIPELIPADEGQPVVVPVIFDTGAADNVNTFVFDIRYDAQLLSLDTTDNDHDDIPDSIQVDIPIGYSITVEDTVDAGTGSIFVTVLNVSSPLSGMPSRTMMEITFVAAITGQPTVTNVVFAGDPAPFFATKQGQVISGLFDGGSVAIGDVPLPSPSATNPATATATGTSMPTTPTTTSTPLPVAFYMPAIVYAFTPTPSATPSPVAPTATATATVAPPTETPVNPTVTATAKPPTKTPEPPTPTPGPFCGELVLNGGMENNSGWLINVNAFPASYVSGFAHTGSRSMRIGIVNYWDNRYSYSSIQQDLTIPSSANQATLRYWLVPTTTGRAAARVTPPEIVPTELTDGTLEPLADDVQMTLLFDQAGNQHVLMFQRQNFNGWAYYEMNLNAFIGQRVILYFGVFNNGTGGITGMYLDDVSLAFCN